MDQIRQALAGQEFAHLDQARAAMDAVVSRENQRPRAAFHGLSADQMDRLLRAAFSSPELVSFARTLSPMPPGPLFALFMLLATAIGEKGVKTTIAGNLPRKLVREIAVHFYSETAYEERTRLGAINSEADFFELHVTRVVAELAGLVRKYRGRLILSRPCRAMLADATDGQLAVQLLETVMEGYNWGYWDGYGELPILQRSFAFSLYLFHLYGEQWRPGEFYGRQLLTAFPMLLDEVVAGPYSTPEQDFLRCYEYRCLRRIFTFAGLLEERVEEGAGADGTGRSRWYRKTELLEKWSRFSSS